MATNKPWDRLEDETAKAWEAFTLYRDMGANRSIRSVAEKLQKSETLIGRWSRTYDWVERAVQWDEEQDRIVRKAQLDDIKKMRKRHAEIATDMLVKAAAALEELPADEIKAADISRMVDIASKLERISRGDVGEVIEERDGGEAVNPVQIYIPSNSSSNGKDDPFDDIEV